ncbi:hypothetical protein F5X96DRAFT_661418 [Biscogniauxia mediterranea]|nr:hypothetical protein F5X96DRAFT_661418 [Biscogniauxia mediterranea]
MYLYLIYIYLSLSLLSVCLHVGPPLLKLSLLTWYFMQSLSFLLLSSQPSSPFSISSIILSRRIIRCVLFSV